MKKTVMRKYAQLAVRRGAHVKKGQGCVIYAQVEQHEFAQMVAEEPFRYPALCKAPLSSSFFSSASASSCASSSRTCVRT